MAGFHRLSQNPYHHNVKRIATLSLALTLTLQLLGQVPNTELYLFKLTEDDTSGYHIHSPRYLSGFNSGGYTNQPSFFDDNTLYVSVFSDSSGQNDIYALHLRTNEIEQVTTTPESEFSPTLHPDGESFTCIRQVIGGETDQQLFRYPLDRSDDGRSVWPEIKNIGYHTWLNNDEAALFLVTDPVKLSWAERETGTNTVIASRIGRALKTNAQGNLAYVHKYNDEFWYLKNLNDNEGDSEIIARMPLGTEDFTVSSKGVYFCGSGSVLFVLDPSKNDEWRPVADLSIFGLEKITRLDVNRRGEIAIVSNQSSEP